MKELNEKLKLILTDIEELSLIIYNLKQNYNNYGETEKGYMLNRILQCFHVAEDNLLNASFFINSIFLNPEEK